MSKKKENKSKRKRYVILKHMENNQGKKVWVILLEDMNDAIWEFKTREKAEKIAKSFNVNSDSGHTYTVSRIGRLNK